MVCCRKGSMADSFFRMVTGWAMRYSKRSPSSRPTASATMELPATPKYGEREASEAMAITAGGGGGAAIALARIESRFARSEERRGGEECRSRWSPYHLKKKKRTTARRPNRRSHFTRVPRGDTRPAAY